MITDVCSCCRLPFTVTAGLIRAHDDHRGNQCPGSNRPPFVLVVPPWAEEAS